MVIPTRGRPEKVDRAVRSALAQTWSDLEVVVVVDGEDPLTVQALAAIGDARLDWRVRPESGGPSAARNLGVRESRGRWIAFLDDDDEWYADKLELQLARAAQTADPERLVLATGAHWVTDSGVFSWPVRGPRPDESVADYLFVRTWPGEGVLATPTLMLSRELALSCPLPEDLHRHEDYDWFLRLEQAGAAFEVLLTPLVRVEATIQRDSLSRGVAWRESLAWALNRRTELGPAAFSGFVLADVGRAAARGDGATARLAVLVVALTGSPRIRDVARYAVVLLLPERVRWRVGKSLRRLRR